MQLTTMHSPTFNSFPIPLPPQYLTSHSIPQSLPFSTTLHVPTHYALSYSQRFTNSSHSPISPFPFKPPVTSSQHQSPCNTPLCTLQQSTFYQFLSPTNISLLIQTPSNIQSAALTMQLPTMHCPAGNPFPIPLTHQYRTSHSIPQYYPVSNIQHVVPYYELSCNQMFPNSSYPQTSPFPFNPPVTSSQQHSP